MRVLLATDGSKPGSAAVGAIEKLRLTHSDEVMIISVVDIVIPAAIDIYGGYLPDTGELEKAAKINAEKVVSEAASIVKGFFPGPLPPIETEILFGTPEARIVEKAEQIKADIIVLGSHGYTAWERMLLGSVSNSVVHHAPCSVFVVRSESK